MKQKTRDELIAENTLNLKEKVDLQSADIDIRRALSKMLNAPFKKRGPYDNYDTETITFTWPQIYFEIGKLSAAVTFYDLEGNVSELEVLTNQMRENWEKYFKEIK